MTLSSSIGRDSPHRKQRARAADCSDSREPSRPGRGFYTVWCNDDGKVVDDGGVFHIAENHLRLTSTLPSLEWLIDNSSGFDVTIEDVSEELVGIALQGPTSRDLLQKLTSVDGTNATGTMFESGRLFAADFEAGRWLHLDFDSQEALRKDRKKKGALRFESQADVLLGAHKAALALGATPSPRPEDLEIHPEDGSVFVAFTNDTKSGDPHGRIAQRRDDRDRQ